MPEKRKSAGRRQSEVPSKKQVHTSIGKSSPSKPLIIECTLPSKVSSGEALPVVSGSSNATQERLKSIAESGVLAASIERSRIQWITEGLFEKYWKKPGKKKDQADLSSNPDKNSMQRLALCRIVVEPHIFEATLFTIRDTSIPSKAPPKANKPPITTASASPFQAQPLPFVHQQPSQTSGVNSVPSGASQAAPVTQQAKPAQDPVIQMLAQRASKDPSLKALMQTVASGHADMAQLQIFQSHINELNGILQRQRESESQSQLSTPQSHSFTTAPSTPMQAQPKHELSTDAPAPPPAIRTSIPAVAPTPSIYMSQPSRPLPAAPISTGIAGIAIEFTGGSGDRFLLPRHSVFEYDSSTKQVILSFLIMRKPSTTDNMRYVAGKDYYQPVTMRIVVDKRDEQRTFDSISRALYPLVDVQKHMKSLMVTADRAEMLPLALQLPSRPDSAGVDASTSSTPITAKSGDRRQSLLKQSTTQGTPSRNSPLSDRTTFEDQHCMYCFEPVYAPVQKLEEKTVCQVCGPLRRKDLALQSGVWLASDSVKLRAGPKVLML